MQHENFLSILYNARENRDQGGFYESIENIRKRLLGGSHRLERAQFPRVRNGKRHHVQRLSHSRRKDHARRYRQGLPAGRNARTHPLRHRARQDRRDHIQPRRTRPQRRAALYPAPCAPRESLRGFPRGRKRPRRLLRRSSRRRRKDGGQTVRRQTRIRLRFHAHGALA